MVHAENHDMIRWLADRLIDGGHTAPKFHAVAHAKLAEEEATSRVIYLSELLDVPIFIVHVSAPGALDVIRAAQSRGLKVFAETCPQYLFLTADDLDKDAMEGAKFCCSPPPRDQASQEAMWRGIVNGTFQVVSSDHAPFRFDKSGKLISRRRRAIQKRFRMEFPVLRSDAAVVFGRRANRPDRYP
jgi:dihydropyrimidinase